MGSTVEVFLGAIGATTTFFCLCDVDLITKPTVDWLWAKVCFVSDMSILAVFHVYRESTPYQVDSTVDHDVTAGVY